MPLHLDPTGGADPASPAGGDGGLRARLLRTTEWLEGQTTQEWPIPGRSGLLVARYRRLTHDERVKPFLADRSLVDRNALFLADAVDEVLGRDAGDDVHLGEHDRPLRYEQELAEYLGYQVDDEDGVIGVVLAVFACTEAQMREHAEQGERWMIRLEDEREARALGEVEGPPR